MTLGYIHRRGPVFQVHKKLVRESGANSERDDDIDDDDDEKRLEYVS